MTFITVFNQIAILSLMIIIGYGIKKFDVLNDQLNKGISGLVLKVTLPAMIIKSMQFEFSREVLMTSFKMILLSLLVHGLAIGISYIVYKYYKKDGPEGDVIQFILVFSNVGYMGYPVIYAIYGDMGVFYAALFNIPFNVLLWTIGVSIMTRNSRREKEDVNYLKLIFNPGIIAVVLGFGMFLLSIKIPYVIYETLHSVGEMTVPLSMLVIGAMLGEMPLKEVFNEKRLISVSIIRLLAIPLIAMLILWGMGFRGILLGVPVVIAGMPAAANTAVFATIYDTAPHFASKAVFVTTLLSMITIPLLSLLL
ncbi:AEC family transporter [Alkaliphilus transvaalensis]|uniref:AEC family transporter n=1 Tax=Alkaliphilus transvaalensis TaxID=114628 RepID=UPI00047C2B91|nr:AEC family transporter [Alkaliphilus transvaalensis]